jgi:parvulin-like peptidyl-prolyl isomerase
MARDRERRGRAAEQARDARQARLIYIVVGSVLGLAALVIVAGVYVTSYRPPRDHVLSVGGSSYQTRDVVDRATFAFIQGEVTIIPEIARETADLLVEEETLRQVAPGIVEPVTADDIRRQLLIDIGLAIDDGTPADDTATPEATPDSAVFASLLTTFLRDAELGRDEYEAIVEARLYRERLRDVMTAEVGTSGPQIRLQRIRVSTQLAGDAVLGDLEAGLDFATLADEQSVAEEDGDGGDIGWTRPDLQVAYISGAIEGLEAGQWSGMVDVGGLFEIYRVAEVAKDRAYEDDLLGRLIDQWLDEWFVEAIASLEVKDDLSEDEETWISEQVFAELSERLGG